VKGLETAAALHNVVSDEKFSLCFFESQKQKYFRDTEDGTTEARHGAGPFFKRTLMATFKRILKVVRRAERCPSVLKN
jgi:hypothetical protein